MGRSALFCFLTLLLGSAATPPSGDGIHKIRHVIIIMQENRSFDSYFGTFPGADGIPMRNGIPQVCVPDPKAQTCVRPYHDSNDEDTGGPHGAHAADLDVDGGRMDGFITVMRRATGTGGCPTDIPTCVVKGHERTVMGYHTGRELPDYWAYARNFVLQDHMFEPIASWSLPQHVYMVSEWAASCATIGDPMSCKPERVYFNPPDFPRDLFDKNDPQAAGRPSYAWTDLTYLLHRHGVSWSYYVMDGFEPDCINDQSSCNLKPQSARTPGIWNPLPSFTDVRADGDLGNVKDMSRFFSDVGEGRLPARRLARPGKSVQRASARAAQHRSGIRCRHRERGDAQQVLEFNGNFFDLGRLGRLLRPRRAAQGQLFRLRIASTGPPH